MLVTLTSVTTEACNNETRAITGEYDMKTGYVATNITSQSAQRTRKEERDGASDGDTRWEDRLAIARGIF